MDHVKGRKMMFEDDRDTLKPPQTVIKKEVCTCM